MSHYNYIININLGGVTEFGDLLSTHLDLSID